jgi:RimJ/RimL family protein N-acetyltransferase
MSPERFMPYYKKLVGKKCYLSPCRPGDAEKWAEWFNDLAVTIPLGDEAYIPSTREGEQETIASIIKSGDHVFSIIELASDELIGRCMLFGMNRIDRTAMFGIVIGEKACWGQGYGQEATRLTLDYAFSLLNLNSVMLGVFAFNTQAINCYLKVGFKEIGRRRQARIIGGQKYDAILMDILAEEFTSDYVNTFIGPETGV